MVRRCWLFHFRAVAAGMILQWHLPDQKQQRKILVCLFPGYNNTRTSHQLPTTAFHVLQFKHEHTRIASSLKLVLFVYWYAYDLTSFGHIWADRNQKGTGSLTTTAG